MFGKIQDLERFQNDQKRFNLAIDSTSGSIQAEGKQLLAELNYAVKNFDDAISFLYTSSSESHSDRALAQEEVYKTKTAIEKWVTAHVPNIHMDS